LSGLDAVDDACAIEGAVVMDSSKSDSAKKIFLTRGCNLLCNRLFTKYVHSNILRQIFRIRLVKSILLQFAIVEIMLLVIDSDAADARWLLLVHFGATMTLGPGGFSLISPKFSIGFGTSAAGTTVSLDVKGFMGRLRNAISLFHGRTNIASIFFLAAPQKLLERI